MSKPRRRTIAALALTLIATSATVAVPSSQVEAATIYYNGAGSAPRISIIGDSTIAALRWTGTFGPLRVFNYTYDAESCRRTVLPSCRGREGYTPDTTLNAMRRLSGQLGSVLVIMGGYDDPSFGFDAAVDAVMAEAVRQGIPNVMWLTLRHNVSYVGPGGISYAGTFRAINSTLMRKAIQYGPRLQIADWASYSANHPEWFYADGIHFRPTGASVVASYIASQARRIIDGQIITPPEGRGVPSVPRSLTSYVYPDRVTLTWAPPTSTGGLPITSYLVQRSTDGGRTWTNVAGVKYPTRVYTVTGLTSGVTYTFRVAAKNERGWSPVSNYATGTPRLMPPWPPRSLTAWAYPERATLGWIVPAMNGGRPITAYLVQRSTDGGRTWVNVAGVRYPTRRYTVNGLTPGTTYTFRVAALNAIGWSRVSNYATVTSPNFTAPSPPRSLSAWVYPDKVLLRWNQPVTNGGRPITAYLIKRSSDGGRTWENVAGVPYTNRVYTYYAMTGLSPGTTYTFRVAALNAIGWSRVSNYAKATPTAAAATALLVELPTTTAPATTTTSAPTTTVAPNTTSTTTTLAPSTTVEGTVQDTAPALSESTIGDVVWLDSNGNGLQEPDETGIEGVDVVLLDSSGTELARDTTDQFGNYEFTEVPDGSYLLEIELPAGHTVTLADQGFDDELDSDLVTVDEQRNAARTNLFVTPAEHPDGFDLGIAAALVETTASTSMPDVTTTEVSTTTSAPTTVPPTTTTTTTEPAPATEATTTLAPTTSAVPTTVAPTSTGGA